MTPSTPALILYLEDNRQDAELVRDHLVKSAISHRLCVVDSRDEYAAALRGRQFDLILCDYQLPTISGPAALVMAQDLQPDVPVIFVSGAVGEEKAIDTLKSGATDFVMKQRLTRLVPAVERALSEAHSRREQSRTAGALQAAQDQLRESEARFRNMADHSPGIVWVTDADAECNYLSRAWFEFTGQTDDEAVAYGWQTATHPDDRRLVGENFRAAHARREPFRMEYRLRRKDGAYRWVLDAAAPRFSESGAFLGYVGSVIDIHDRRQAEDDLRDARSRLESALEAGGIGTWVWDVPAARVFSDAKLAALFGVTAAESQGGPVARYFQAIHPEDADRVAEVINYAIKTGGRYEVDFRLRAPAWATVWVIARGRVERDRRGVPARMAGVVQDVTERRLAELERQRLTDQIEHERKRLRTVLDAAPVGVIVADAPAGKVSYVNPMVEELLGSVPPPTAVAEYGRYEAYYADGRRLEAADYTLARALRGETVRNVEYKYHHPDGSFRWMRLSGSPLWDGKPEPTGAVVVFSDVDREKRALEDLEEADRHKNEFLAMLAHELRNPLAPVSNALQTLKTGRNPAYLATATDMMERQVRHLGRLIDDLLDVSRIGRGKVALKTEVLDVRAVVARAVESARPQAEAGGHTLTADYPEAALPVTGDPTRLEQVFANLLNNAVKYTEAGGHIAVAVRAEGGRAVVDVRDTGVGISSEQLAKVFELFMQVTRSLDRSQGGLGIGLTLVRSLVELHGGTVSAHSDGLGRGAVFTVSLPLAVDANAPVKAATPPLSVAAKRICVVDDNVDGALSLAMLLQALGHTATVAHDGPAGEALIRRERPDAAVMDIGLPGLNGYEVAKRLRGDFPPETLCLIALTGYGQDEDRRRSAEAGFDHHLVKPVEIDVLTRILAGVPAAERA